MENWREYDAALRDRGSLTVRVTPEAIAAWHPANTGRPGRSAHYSDLAIETGVMPRPAFAPPWRQTEELLRAVMTLLGLSLDVPDHTTLSRRSAASSLVTALTVPAASVTAVIDSTGLKVFGAGEWQIAEHGGRDRRTWRKFHPAIDPHTGEVLALALTTTEHGDALLVGPPLDQIAAPIASVMADGAVRRRSSLPGRCGSGCLGYLDHSAPRHHRRRQAAGYGRRSLVETAMLRYKTIIGRTLRARTLCTKDQSPGRLQGAQPHDQGLESNFMARAH